MEEKVLMKLKDLSEKPVIQEKESQKQKTERKIQEAKLSLVERLNEIGTISTKEVVEFTRNLSVMLSAGVTIFESINFLKDETGNKTLQARLNRIITSLNNGQSLSQAMKRYPKVFPDIYTNIVAVGEQSGTLSETMIDLANHLEESEQFKSKVKGAMIYPKIIVSVMMTFMFAIFFWVMPRILGIFEGMGAEVPASTQVIMNITDFLRANIILLIIGIVGAIILYKVSMKNRNIREKRDLLILRIPVLGKIVINYNTTQIAQHFGTLFESGLTIIKCLEITSSVVKNVVFQEEVKYMVEKIRKGSSLSQSFRENNHFPPMFSKLIKVGERTGKLPHVISYLKGYYKGMVDSDVKNITTIIEPVIMVLLGLMVAALVLTVIGPIYQLISNIDI